ncbi:hypothetical protein DXG01_013274 [Tephrocybe rancida]|nr:hypothetical protein DXG01_013274 [Tephrocybe rancida]
MSYAQLPDPHPSFRSPSRESVQMRTFFVKAIDRAPVSPARRRKILFSYLPDWILTIVLAALFFSLDKVEGYRREFSVTDTSLRHPYAVHERIPARWDVSHFLPLAYTAHTKLTFRSVILGLAITGAITQFTKITVGRPRPDVLDRCQLPPGTADPEFGLSFWQLCTQTDNAILRDGFRSFPSGHSSLSFAGLGFLAFYIAGKLHLFDRRGHAGKAWLAVAPFCGAALVAISRTMDYRHHWHDVLVGSLLGTVVSYFTYRQYYPSLADELSHRPYSPRIKREHTEVLPTHHHHSDSSEHGTSLPQHQAPYGTGEEYELSGTVQRPNLPLEEVWQDGAHELSAPRSMTADIGPATTLLTHDRVNETA